MKPMPTEPTVLRKGTVLFGKRIGDSYELLTEAAWEGSYLGTCRVKSQQTKEEHHVNAGATWCIGYEDAEPEPAVPPPPPRWNRTAQRLVLLVEMTTPLAERLERLK